MDFSLKQILEIADNIHRKVFSEESSITISDYINSIHQLQAYVEQIKSIVCRVETIHRVCLDKMKEHINKTKVDERNINMIGTYEWGEKVMKGTRERNQLLCPSSYVDTKVSIVHNIDTNTKVVKNVDMIPNTKIYWVDDIKQFVIRINNIVIKGNIGNILTKNEPLYNVVKCRNGLKCINNECLYLHSSATRNYTNSSWIYSPHPITKKNKYMRHIGNRNSLYRDIERMKRRDKKIKINKETLDLFQGVNKMLKLFYEVFYKLEKEKVVRYSI